MTPEDRQKMAAAHENMATCLKSDRPLAECRTEMKRECPMMHKDGTCGGWMTGKTETPKAGSKG